jgi:hypothetical protein
MLLHQIIPLQQEQIDVTQNAIATFGARRQHTYLGSRSRCV